MDLDVDFDYTVLQPWILRKAYPSDKLLSQSVTNTVEQKDGVRMANKELEEQMVLMNKWNTWRNSNDTSDEQIQSSLSKIFRCDKVSSLQNQSVSASYSVFNSPSIQDNTKTETMNKQCKFLV